MMNNLKFVTHVSEKETDEYLILAEYPEIDYTLLVRDTSFQPYVAAWAFNKEKNNWGQGHYFSDIVEACDYIKTKLDEKRDIITYARMSELATRFKDGFMEADEDYAMEWFEGECDMTKEEYEYFGIDVKEEEEKEPEYDMSGIDDAYYGF